MQEIERLMTIMMQQRMAKDMETHQKWFPKGPFLCGEDNSPPINGPMVNPRPNAAPIKPIRLARFE